MVTSVSVFWPLLAWGSSDQSLQRQIVHKRGFIDGRCRGLFLGGHAHSVWLRDFAKFVVSKRQSWWCPVYHLHLSTNREGRWGTTGDFTTSFLRFCCCCCCFFLFSTALWDLANSRPVHSLMLSSHLVCLLPSFTVPCKMVSDRPDGRET